MPVLGLPPKQHSSRQPLNCQHRRYKTMTHRAAGKQRGSKASQRNCRPSGRLTQCQGSVPVPRTLICPRDNLFWGDKLSPQWSSCRTFQHWQDKRVGRPEILLAELVERYRELCPRMRRLSDFKSRPLQTLWRLVVLAFTNPSIEKPLHGLRDRPAFIRWLERQQLWLDSCYCWPIDQDGAL